MVFHRSVTREVATLASGLSLAYALGTISDSGEDTLQPSWRSLSIQWYTAWEYPPSAVLLALTCYNFLSLFLATVGESERGSSDSESDIDIRSGWWEVHLHFSLSALEVAPKSFETGYSQR